MKESIREKLDEKGVLPAKAQPVAKRDTFRIEIWPIAKPIPYARNARKIPQQAIDKVAASIKEFGWQQPIVVDVEGVIVVGHTRLLAAQKLELAEVPVHVASDLTPAQIKAYRLMDNRSHQESTWDLGLLIPEMAELEAMSIDLALTGFDPAELSKFTAETTEGLTDPDAVPEAPEFPVTEPGDLWVLGRHRLLCGDSTSVDAVERLMGGEKADMLLTDPPYCSGGFQETGKSSKRAGSIGTRGTETIANDTLSSRGYMALIKQVLINAHVGVVYIFTDWRMWVNLFDVVESSGFGVRNMIVWDKGTPGMGCGWRMQHELVMCGIRVTSPFNPKKAQGNVIQSKRTGNVNHSTEKPVDLIFNIMEVTDMATSVLDTFAGSGTTIIAAEKAGRKVFAMELTPNYCDVIVKRWQEFTGKQAQLEDGRTFDQLATERSGVAQAA
jgi:DNA modification methylase